MQNYLMSSEIPVNLARFMFLARSRMLNLRTNYSSQYKQTETYCQACLDVTKQDSQQHLFVCNKMTNNRQILSSNLCYEDLFNSDDIFKQHTVAIILKSNYDERTRLIQERRQSQADIYQQPSDPNQ